jgi:hypothetical protein
MPSAVMLLLSEVLLQLVISKSARNDSPLTSNAKDVFIITSIVIATDNCKKFLNMAFP